MAQATGIYFDANYKKLELAMKRLPEFVETSVKFYTRRTAIQFTKFLKDQVRGRQLRLKPLKIRVGGTPLYLTGEMVEKVGIRYYKRSKGGIYYVGAVSGRVHSGSGLTLAHLWKIHEYGTTIKVTAKMRAYLHSINIHLKPTTMYIRIPPRPAMRRAWQKFIRNTTLKKQRNKELQNQVSRFLRTARIQWRIIRDARAREY